MSAALRNRSDATGSERPVDHGCQRLDRSWSKPTQRDTRAASMRLAQIFQRASLNGYSPVAGGNRTRTEAVDVALRRRTGPMKDLGRQITPGAGDLVRA
jgi:hypothetical protein